MVSVAEDIAQDRANKKHAVIRVLLIGGVFVLVYFGGFWFIDSLWPESSTEPQQVEISTSAPAVNLAQLAEQRKAMQQALSLTGQHLDGLRAKLDGVGPYAYRVEALNTQMQTAYQAYEQGKYDSVTSILNEVSNGVVEIDGDFENDYEHTYTSALKAFNDNSVATAESLVQKALELKPGDSQATQLKQRLDVFYDVEDAFEQARVGQVENDLAKQQQAYQRIISLDPARQEAQVQLKRVQNELRQQDIKTRLSDIASALDKNELDNAQQLIASTRQTYGALDELNTFQNALNQTRRDQELTQLESQVNVFIAADEWQTAKMVAEKGLTRYPQSPFLQQAVDNAKALDNANMALQVYLSAPARLADDNIRQQAQQALTQYQSLDALSSKLADKMQTLSEQIDVYAAAIPVTITSDNKTHIAIKGVGIVGKTRNKIVSLKPGRYQIEGSRKGFRTRLIDLVVSPSQPAPEVELVCVERI